MKLFQDVRDWKRIRGIGSNSLTKEKELQGAFQRVQQEITEVHEALVQDDFEEFQDAIGDSIVTLINLADLGGYKAEECLEKAFNVIKLRKGLINPKMGDFVRYAKLSEKDQAICDLKQGSSGEEYFTEEALKTLKPEDFSCQK